MKTTILNVARKAIAAIACSAFVLGAIALPQSAEAKKAKKIGIQLYSVMGAVQKDPKASVERLASMGYNVFELVQWGGNPKVFGLSAEEFKALCEKNGVSIVSTHSSIQEDPAKEAEVMQRWRDLFAIQKASVVSISLSQVTAPTTL